MVNRTAAGRYGVRLALAVALTAAIPCLGVQASASADPTEDTSVADGGSHLVSTDEIDDRQSTMQVYSASMDREIPLRVITPADTSEPRPTPKDTTPVAGSVNQNDFHASTARTTRNSSAKYRKYRWMF